MFHALLMKEISPVFYLSLQQFLKACWGLSRFQFHESCKFCLVENDIYPLIIQGVKKKEDAEMGLNTTDAFSGCLTDFFVLLQEAINSIHANQKSLGVKGF